MWELYSRTLRIEAADSNGICACYTCGVRKHWKEMQGGHFVNQSHGLAATFCEDNVRVQCVRCNMFLEGNKDAYVLRLLSDKGEEYVKRLERLRYMVVKNFNYAGEIAFWRQRLQKAIQEKGFLDIDVP